MYHGVQCVHSMHAIATNANDEDIIMIKKVTWEPVNASSVASNMIGQAGTAYILELKQSKTCQCVYAHWSRTCSHV